MSHVYPFLQAVLDGILTGSLYALIAMGMALIFGVMRIVNFAHGAFLMLGMYATWVIFERAHLNPYLGFLAAGLLLFAIGAAVYQAILAGATEWIAEMTAFSTDQRE